jgi:hypothetical protein
VESGFGIRTGPWEKMRGPQRRPGEGEVARKRVARGAQVREKVFAWGSTCSFLCRPAFARASNCVAPEVTHGRLSARLASSTVTLAERAGRLYLLSTNSLRRRRRASGAARNGPAGKNGRTCAKSCRPAVAFRRPASPMPGLADGRVAMRTGATSGCHSINAFDCQNSSAVPGVPSRTVKARNAIEGAAYRIAKSGTSIPYSRAAPNRRAAACVSGGSAKRRRPSLTTPSSARGRWRSGPGRRGCRGRACS